MEVGDRVAAGAVLAGGAEDAPGVVKPAPAPSAPAAASGKKNLGLLLTLLAMVGAVVALFLGVFQPAAVYATPVDKLVHEQAAFVGRKVRVEGELVPGTLTKRDQPCEYHFTLHKLPPKDEAKAKEEPKDDVALPVRYAQCVIPDGFRDVPSGGVQVTVEGSLASSGDFQASLVMAKCSSKYNPAEHKMMDGPAPGNLPVN
jgi:cytochrome c-type biogenesis protein CcmE